MAYRAWLGLAGLLSIASCNSVDAEVSLPFEQGLIRQVVKSDPSWLEACRLPPEERLGLPAPVQVGAQRGLAVQPVEPELVLELRQVIAELPRPLARVFARHVCGVVLVHGSPMSGTLRMLEQDPSRGIIVLDVDKLKLSPNAWMSFKESSVYALAANQRIVGKLAEPEQDVRSTLLEFLLVHELGHVIDSAGRDESLIASFKHVGWPRTDLLVSRPLIHYPERLQQPPLSQQMVEQYFELIASGPYSSPAAVSGDHEDFADSLATYAHTVIRERPWRLELYEDGELRRGLSACWAELRCFRKRLLLEMMLERWLRG